MDPIKPDQIQLEPQEHVFNKVLKFTLVILILASIGLGGFMFSQIKNIKNTPNALIPTTIISPKAAAKVTVSPTPQSAVDPNDINIGSVEADLKDIGTDIEALK